MYSRNLILWLNGVKFNKLPLFCEPESLPQQLLPEFQSVIVRELSDAIGRYNDSYNFQQVPALQGDVNLLSTDNTKKIFLVCSTGYYTVKKLENDLNIYNPDLIIFVSHPKGITRAEVSKVAHDTGRALMALQIPEVITYNAGEIENNRIESTDTDYTWNSQNANHLELCLSHFKGFSPERISTILKNSGKAIIEIAKFINNLLEAWNRGCRLFDVYLPL